MFIGIALILVGIVALLIALGVLNGTAWGYAWPIILIVLGVALMVGRSGRRAYWRRRWGPPEDQEKK